MKIKIIRDTKEYTDPLSGYTHPDKYEEIEFPFEVNDEIYVVLKVGRKKHYEVYRFRVIGAYSRFEEVGMLVSRIPKSWCDNPHDIHVPNDKLNLCFKSESDAIEMCLKINQLFKVKVNY